MNRKPIILILTSRDEIGGASKNIADGIKKIGTHNAVVFSDDKYGSVKRASAFDMLLDTGSEYQYLRESKDKGVLKGKLKLRSFSKRVNRINNLLKRFHPEFILCTTPYAHHCAIEAKRKAHFDTDILYVLSSFTLGKRVLDDETSALIVENADIKADLVREGVRSKDVLTMGLPYEISPKTPDEIKALKEEFGLLKSKTVLLNMDGGLRRDAQNKNRLRELFELMLDQGNIINLVVVCKDQKLRQTLSALAVKVQNMKVVFVPSEDRIDEYISVCDVAVTKYDVSVIYKCFKLGIPSIVMENGERERTEVEYLVSRGLCLPAKENIDVVGQTYKLLQTDASDSIIENGKEWVDMKSLDNICNFLVAYIGT
ncbi:MAG: hypothetical protein J5713_01075 [Clostridia bacterium]|nr:hypothetical protein [Clostridia bacterium]